MEKRIDQISLAIASVYRGIQRSNSEALENLGMNNVHSVCIYEIGTNPGISATGICKKTATDKAAVSKTLGKLINDGYVERPILSKRAYRTGIYLTEKGQELFEITKQKVESLDSKAFRGISTREFNSFYKILNRIASNLEA